MASANPLLPGPLQNPLELGADIYYQGIVPATNGVASATMTAGSSVLRGIIPASGTTATAGTGFTYTHTNTTGVYVFTFSTAFAAAPVVVGNVTDHSGAQVSMVQFSSVSTTGFTATTFNGSDGSVVDRAFNFIAYEIG